MGKNQASGLPHKDRSTPLDIGPPDLLVKMFGRGGRSSRLSAFVAAIIKALAATEAR